MLLTVKDQVQRDKSLKKKKKVQRDKLPRPGMIQPILVSLVYRQNSTSNNESTTCIEARIKISLKKQKPYLRCDFRRRQKISTAVTT